MHVHQHAPTYASMHRLHTLFKHTSLLCYAIWQKYAEICLYMCTARCTGKFQNRQHLALPHHTHFCFSALALALILMQCL